MTQPQTLPWVPSPNQLGPVAQKLLSESATQTRYIVTRKDLSILLSLLLRLRLRKAKWGSPWFHFGAFDEADASDKELADILVDGLGGDQEEGFLSSTKFAGQWIY